ncbi:apolipoprotein N-acyltransferase [Microbacterium binotii]|uniref:Apolipoprotein N-acyltransferase n=1 Tax=Microbacterium binotii TaxID=462710 RepID=A0ABN3PF73_9MICO
MPRPRALLPLWAAVLASVLGGLALTTAFPALSWWPLVFVAIPLALVSLIGRSVGGAFLVGTAYGAAFFLVNVSFTARFLGPVPWLALSVLEAVLTGAAAILITWAYRWVPRALRGMWPRLIVLPLLVAGLWVLREQWVGTFPYGGFPWGRVGVTQVNGPLAPLLSWVGMSGVGFVVVFLCASVIEYVRVRRFRDVRTIVPTLLVALIAVATPAFATTAAGTLRIGSVQGNGPAGYFDQRARGALLDAQLKATEAIADDRMDLLVWPEGGIDSDPTSNETTAATLDTLSNRIGAPLLVNAATARGGRYFNTSMLWNAGEGVVASYDKIHPVPFGEYVPDRPFFAALAPDLINLIQREYTPGTAEPVVELGDTPIGLAICFDVIYDDVVWAASDGGAQLFVYQTNNADFRGTDENLQQLAFARARAIETGRAVVNISTVGTSQVIAPTGEVIDGIAADTAGAMLTEVPLRNGTTAAMVLGPALHAVFAWGSLMVLLAAGLGAKVRGARENRG